MKEFGLQLWSIREHFKTVEDTKDAFSRIAAMGYTKIQTAGTYDYISPAEFRSLADAYGLTVVGTHYSFDRIRDHFAETVAYHRALGTNEIGIGGYATPTFASLQEFIKEFNRLGKAYAKEGFVLSYHNHSGEFSRQFREIEGKCKFDYLVDGLDPETTCFNLDSAWVHLAGVDVRATIERLRGRINILHLKDVEADVPYMHGDALVMRGPRRIEIGRGNMNFRDIIQTGEACGIKYFVVEDEVYSTGVPMESVAMSAAYIRENLLEV